MARARSALPVRVAAHVAAAAVAAAAVNAGAAPLVNAGSDRNRP
jgi:hypothetical protein